jgi:hypothetical protein
MDEATSLANITVSSTHDTMAYKMFHNLKPTVYANLQPFGRIGYVTKRNKIKRKFSEKSVKCICLGHAENHAEDVYRTYNTETNSTQFSRNIKWADWHGGPEPTENIDEIGKREEIPVENENDDSNDENEPMTRTNNSATITDDEDSDSEEEEGGRRALEAPQRPTQ